MSATKPPGSSVIERFRCGPGPRVRKAVVAPTEAACRERIARMRATVACLVRSKLIDEACFFIEQAANAGPEKVFAGIERAARDLAEAGGATGQPLPVRTFRSVAEAWLSGDIRKQYPRIRMRNEASARHALGILRLHVFPVIGAVPIRDLTEEQCDQAMAAFPATLEASTLRVYAALIARVLKLSANPLRLIKNSPLSDGWVPPRQAQTRAFGFLYPKEDAKLLACSAIPLLQRLMYGLMTRNGLRISEAVNMTWSDIDIEHETIKLDTNKTKDPRFWIMDPDVVAAVAAVKPADAEPTARIFPDAKLKRAAQNFRKHLLTAGIDREELQHKTAHRRPLRVHDLRASFVTIALADGRPDVWVTDRTGHTTAQQLMRYRRRARQLAEMNLGWFEPLDRCLGLTPEPSPQAGHGVGQIIMLQPKLARRGISRCTSGGPLVQSEPPFSAAKRTPSDTTKGLGPPQKGGVGQPTHGGGPNPVRDLSAAIASAAAAGKWVLVERLTAQLEGLETIRGSG